GSRSRSGTRSRKSCPCLAPRSPSRTRTAGRSARMALRPSAELRPKVARARCRVHPQRARRTTRAPTRTTSSSRRTASWPSPIPLSIRGATSVARLEPLLDQLGDGAAVRAALRLFHHGADEPPDRLLVPLANLLGGLRLGLDRPVD